MENIFGQALYQLLLPYLIVFIMILSVLTFVVGLGLAMRHPAMMHFYDFMHRRFSLRRMIRPLFMPHFIEPVLHQHLNLLGSAIILGASASILILWDMDAIIFQPVFLDSFAMETAGILADYTKSFLLVGNIACVALGLLALFFPRALSKIEAYTDRWYTLRLQTRALGKMQPEIGNWVLAHPTISGITLSFLSLLVGVSSYVSI